MKRKIIQISICGVDNNMSTQCNFITTALCDDGKVFQIRDGDNDWYELDVKTVTK